MNRNSSCISIALILAAAFNANLNAQEVVQLNVDLEYGALFTDLCGDEVYTYPLKDQVNCAGTIDFDVTLAEYADFRVEICDGASDATKFISMNRLYEYGLGENGERPFNYYYDTTHFYYEANGDLKINIKNWCDNAWAGVSLVGEWTFTNPVMKAIVQPWGGRTAVTVKMHAWIKLLHEWKDLKVHDATCTEGDGGSATMIFNVTVNKYIAHPVTCRFKTDEDVTAASSLDYRYKEQAVRLEPFQLSTTVHVEIYPDQLDEFDETFKVHLSDVSGAYLKQGTATGTILDNDAPPEIVIACDTCITEGDTGSKPVSFMIQKIGATAKTVSVTYETAAGLAESDTDFEAIAPTIIEFAPNESQKSVNCYVKGDCQAEGNETFYFDLSSPVNATLKSSRITVNIIDNEMEETSLPVQLSAFSAGHTADGVQLTWTTQSETDNLGFILERCLGTGDQSAAYWDVIASYETQPALRGRGNASQRTDYHYTDRQVRPGMTYTYRLSDVSTDGRVNVYDIITIDLPETPGETVLDPPFPNPFNPQTRIAYQLAEAGPVEIIVYDLLGRRVRTLMREDQSAGSYNIYWQGDDDAGCRCATGTYLLVLRTEDAVSTQKVIMVQ